MRKRLASVLVLALTATALLALSGVAGAQEQDPVPPPPQGVVPCWILTGQVVDGKLSYELKAVELPAVVKVREAKADVVWNADDGVIEFEVKIELLVQSPGDGGGGFAAGFLGAHVQLEEGTDVVVTKAEWKADASVDGGGGVAVELAGIITPTMIGDDEFFALQIELPAVLKQILPF